MVKSTGLIVILIAVYCIAVIRDCSALDSRQNPNTTVQNRKHEPCGAFELMAQRVERCAKPLTDILQGTLKKWPKNDIEIIDLCHQFQEAEKCIRETSRKCASGLQKVIITTFANSVQRVRKRECIKSKYPDLIKTLRCIETNPMIPQNMVANATSRLNVVEHQMKDLEKKNRAICCMVNDIESETKRLMSPICPNEVSTVIRLFKSVLEDVIQLLCRSPKCQNLYKGYNIPPIMKADFKGLISSILKIVFSLGQ